MTRVIEARGLTKRFGATAALDVVDLDIAPGEIFGVVGPNGAGKTTLLQLLAALLTPSAGNAVVLGCDVRRDAAALRPRMGYVSQEFTLYGTLTVEENLDFFADLYRVPSVVRGLRKEELLAWSRLAAFRDRQAGRLSGGMQKKLHLCSTLIHAPELLLLDEPTTGVDPVSRQELWEILYDLVEQGITLVVATPYMDEADRCHRVALMHRGRMLRCDSPDALRASVTGVVWELRSPALSHAQQLLSRSALPIRSNLIGDRLHLFAPEGVDVTAEVQALLAATDTADLHLRRVPPTMEDVFISLLSEAEVSMDSKRYDGEKVSQPPRAVADGIAVRLEGLTKTFGRFVAVDHVSLSVGRGEVFGFLGPNGSGKTTTIRMLCGLLSPSGGRGTVLGYDVFAQRRRIKVRIGYMSQRFSLYNDLTVGENLAFFGRGYGLPRRRLAERTAWALEMAGLKGEERRLSRELSTGIKQRLALGCAILHEPEVIFLDEPTAGVDPIARRHFWDLIGAMASAGNTVFVTTHYLDEAENCHRLGLMYQGRLIAVGSPQDLKDGMRAGVMLELQCREPFRALQLLRSEPSLARTSLFGSRVHVLVEDSTAAEPMIRKLLRAAGLAIERLEQIPLSLEDLFVIFIDMEDHRRREIGG